MSFDLRCLNEKFTTEYWIESDNWKNYSFSTKKKDIGNLVAEIVESIAQGDHVRTSNYLSFCLLHLKDDFLEKIKKVGLLRASKYKYDVTTLRQVCNFVLMHSDKISLSTESKDYFQNVVTLYSLGPTAFEYYKVLSKGIKSTEDSLLLYMLEHCEYLFSIEKFAVGPREFAASVYSSIIFEMEKNGQLIFNPGCSVKEHESYSKIFEAASQLEFYRKLEVKIDAFNFQLTKDEKGLLIASDIELDKKIEHGFSYNLKQSCLLSLDISKHNTLVSCSDLIPDEIMNDFEKSIRFACDNHFQEEQHILKQCMHDYHCNKEELLNVELRTGVLISDLLKVWRVIMVQNRILKKQSGSLVKTLLPIPAEILVSLFDKITSKKNGKKIYEILSSGHASSSKKKKFIDLQTKPIIETKDGTALFLTETFCKSDFLRNLMVSEEKRVFKGGDRDPLSEGLLASLKEKQFIAEMEVKKKKSRRDTEYEIDVLAYKDGHLFIFECKSTILPTNYFELRTPYSRIKEAAKQLTAIKEKLKTGLPDELDFFSQKLKFKLPKNVEIHYAIVCGNRMFRNHFEGGIPVRSYFELNNMISKGTVGKIKIINGESKMVDLCPIYEEQMTTVERVRKYLYEGLPNELDPVDPFVKLRTLEYGNTTVRYHEFRLE